MNLDEEQLKIKMEELEIPSDKIEEILINFKSMPTGSNSFFYKIFREAEIRKNLEVETDWKKRAILQAELIKLDLE